MTTRIDDAPLWTFLYGPNRIIEHLAIQPGERVLEIGCGTGRNFGVIQRGLQDSGELTGVDCSSPMLREASERVRRNGWKNVLLINHEYGHETISEGRADVVIVSYSLSMNPDWETVLAGASSELRPGGRIGIVDFCRPTGSQRFAEWLAINHVRFVGEKDSISQLEVA